MKKKVIGISLIAVLVLAFGFTTGASADGPNPFGHGRGRHGQGAGGYNHPLHTFVIAEYAEVFGVTAESLEARLADGEKLPDITAEYGYEDEAFTTLMEEVHTAAIAEAVSEGLITQVQADLFAERPGFGGLGRIGQFGKMNGPWGGGEFEEGPLHEYMSAAIADALGLTVEDLEAAKEAKTPLHELVDMEVEEVRELLAAAKESAIEQALADGVITEEDLENFGKHPGPCGPGGRGGEGFSPRNNGPTGSGPFGYQPSN